MRDQNQYKNLMKIGKNKKIKTIKKSNIMTNFCIFGSKSVIFIFYIFFIVIDFYSILYDQNPYKIKPKIINLGHYF